MEPKMEFPQQEAGQEQYDTEAIRNSLKDRIDVETVPHFKSMVGRASAAFDETLNSDDIQVQKDCLETMQRCENYLGEKYRETRQDREYIATLQKGIEYLKSITK